MAVWAPRWCGAPGALLVLLAAVCGCSSTPPSGTSTSPSGAAFDAQPDGAPKDVPPDLLTRPDAEPRIEAIRSGGPNKPYEVLGQRYTPLAADEPVIETGLASWYGRKFHGRSTASGELYDMYAMSAAHRTMPIPSYARVGNPANGREIVVRINDRGPFHKERIIDLSYTAALKLGVLRGLAPVTVMRLTHEDIRTGRWRGQTAQVMTVAPLAPALVAGSTPAFPMAPTPVAAAAGPSPQSAAVDTGPSEASTLAHQPSAEVLDQAQASPVAGPAAARAPDLAAAFWVQLGAFRQRQGAFDLRQQFMRELAWIEPWLAIFDDSAWFKLQAGPFASRLEAQGAAERLRGTATTPPLILQRR
jgi:rare lipoprotein A